MNPYKTTEVIGGKRYSTETATLLAGDDYWDGNNYERHGRNTFLYRTPKNNYFVLNLTQWQGEADGISPLTKDEAIDLFENLREKRAEFEEAFPGEKVEDA